MTKSEFLGILQQVYRIANASDSDFHELRQDWTKPEMAGKACCQHLDRMMEDLVRCGAITEHDAQDFFSTV